MSIENYPAFNYKPPSDLTPRSCRWHQGFCNDSYLPTSRGFESFLGYHTGGEDYYAHTWPDAQSTYDFFDGKEADTAANGTYSAVRALNPSIKIFSRKNTQSVLHNFSLLLLFNYPTTFERALR